MSKENEPMLSFEIKNSKDLFNKLMEEYSDFDTQYLNPRFAVNCAITTWHLTDWIYHEFYKDDDRFQDSIKEDKRGCIKVISGLLKYQQYVLKLCPELGYMRLITNGIKHCVLNDKNLKGRTALHQGDFNNDFSRHDFYVTRFVIETDKGDSINFETTLLKTIDYWKKELNVKE